MPATFIYFSAFLSKIDIMQKITTSLLPLFFILLFTQCKKQVEIDNTPQTVKDADGNVYNTVKIGNQVWMQENLKTTKFNDGTPITKYVFGLNWLNLNAPQALYQWADTSDRNNLYTNQLPEDYYGAMYNHFAIESGKLAPAGWRIPTEADFLILKNHLTNNGHAGRESVALKTNFGWAASTGNGTDAVGFKALPNGYISAFGTTISTQGLANWATTSKSNATNTRRLVSIFHSDTLTIADNSVYIGAGIRCIKE